VEWHLRSRKRLTWSDPERFKGRRGIPLLAVKTEVRHREDKGARLIVLQVVQPGLAGLIEGSMSDKPKKLVVSIDPESAEDRAHRCEHRRVPITSSARAR
jgi:hypothetical protein